MNNKIKIAIVGVGNCASSLIQGISYYSNRPHEKTGLTNRVVKGYDISDIEIVAAFDIDERKVNKPIREAIFSKPNVAAQFETNIVNENITVNRGSVLDGFSEHLLQYPPEKRFQPINDNVNIQANDIINVLNQTSPDFLISYLPVGSIKATEFYAKCALEAGVSFINAIPVFISSSPEWIDKFEKKGLLLLGDDIKSQIGSTILHRVIMNTFYNRGVDVDNTYQLNIGGNTDFLNMKSPNRLKLKWKSKIESVRSQYNEEIENIYAGPAEYITYLEDKKIAYINLIGKGFGNQTIEVEAKLRVEDSANSAGVMVDVIRIAKFMLDSKDFNWQNKLCAYGFKSPVKQYTDGVIFKWFNEFLNK